MHKEQKSGINNGLILILLVIGKFPHYKNLTGSQDLKLNIIERLSRSRLIDKPSRRSQIIITIPAIKIKLSLPARKP